MSTTFETVSPVKEAKEELNLVYGFDPDSIIITESTQELEINKLSFNIANPHQQKYKLINTNMLNPRDDLPSYGGTYDQYKLSWFYIWFPWGSGKGDFATGETSGNITVSPAPDNDNWYCVKKSDPGIGTYWVLFPKKDTVIDPHESIAFTISNILSQTDPGLSYMYIENHKIPGYEDNKVTQKIWKHKRVVPFEINSFYFDPGTIAKGGKTTLLWKTTGSKLCIINPGNKKVDLSGKFDICAEDELVYSLRASNETDSLQKEARLFIGSVNIKSFEASPVKVEKEGDKITLKWETEYASNCSIDPDIGKVSEIGSITVTAKKNTTTYTLTCGGLNGPITQSVTVVIVNSVEIKSFMVDPPETKSGQKATLSWETLNADSGIIDNGIGNIILPKGSVEVSPLRDAVYKLTCTGANGPVSSTVSLAVKCVKITSFYSTGGMNATVYWTTENATSCTLQDLNNGDSSTVKLNGHTEVYTLPNGVGLRLTCEGPGGPVSQEIYVV